MNSNTVAASSRRIVRQALEIAAIKGHRDLDIDEIMSKGSSRVLPMQRRDGCASNPLYCKSPLDAADEQRAVDKHVGSLVNVIHQKEVSEITRIVSLCLLVETSDQLRVGNQRGAARFISTMISATA